MEKEIMKKEDSSEVGATALEYALLAALIAVVIIAAVTFLGQQASVTFSRIGSGMAAANVSTVEEEE